MAKSERSQIITIDPISTEVIEVTVIGKTPLIVNRLSEKARHELLLPKGRKTAADRASSLKHNPHVEFRASPYVFPDDAEPTYLAALAAWFKGAMMSAALHLPGTKRTEIGRLVWIEGEYLPLWGVPKLHMGIVRSADMNRTPDVRTRAIVPEWTTKVVVRFATPFLNERSIINLLAAAGTIAGVGDNRPEKGKGTYGQFGVTDPDDPQVREIMDGGGRAAQVAAMDAPEPYDHEAQQLLDWFNTEAAASGKLV